MNFSKFSFEFFDINIYGALTALTFFFASYYYYGRLKKAKLDLEFFAHHFWRWILVGLFGGRLIACLLNPQIFADDGPIAFLFFWIEGFNFWGAVIAILLLMYRDLSREGKPFWSWFDLMMMPLIVGYMLVDVYGYISGAIYGRETDLFWGIQYETFGVDILNPVHPVTLYALLLHFAWFLWFRKNEHIWIRRPGKSTVLTILVLLLIDLFMHSFRGDSTWVIFRYVRIEQVFDLILISALLWGYRKIPEAKA